MKNFFSTRFSSSSLLYFPFISLLSKIKKPIFSVTLDALDKFHIPQGLKSEDFYISVCWVGYECLDIPIENLLIKNSEILVTLSKNKNYSFIAPKEDVYSKLTKLNFPSMFNLYAEYKMKEGFSHEYMANYYVNIMASALKKYDNNKFDIDTYKAYAWEGLEGTDFYQKYYNSLTLSQKTEMENKKKQLLANRSKLDCNDK